MVDDRSHVTSRPFLHIGCVYRRSGCPFILKCLYRKAEGGWVLRSETVEGTDKRKSSSLPPRHLSLPVILAPSALIRTHSNRSSVDHKNGSIYHCIHHPGAVREVATPLPYITKLKLQEADKPRPAKKARPSLPAPSSAASTSQTQPLRPNSIGSLSAYRMPDGGPAPGSARTASGRDAAGSAAGPSRVGLGAEGGRALAPPFTRAQHLAAQVSPALAGGQAGMGLGTAYAGHTGGGDAPLGRGNFPHPENLERRPPPAPGTFPNSLTPLIRPAGVPPGYLPTAPAPSHHAAYFAAFRPPTYPLPIQVPRFPQPPTGILPMWQHFFHQLDPTLMPLAPILANDAVGVTLAGFYNNSDRVRRALLDELAKYGATVYARVVFGEKMEGEGRKVFEGLMEKAQERKAAAVEAAKEKEKEREEKERVEKKERDRREAERAAAAAVAKAAAEAAGIDEDAMEVDVVTEASGSAMPGTPVSNGASARQPPTSNGSAAPPSATTTGPGLAAPSKADERPSDRAVSRPVSIAPMPSGSVSTTAQTSKPVSADQAIANGDAAKVESGAGPESVSMSAEASSASVPEPANDEPVIDPSLPDLEIEWVINPAEMVARMGANGYEYLSIFRRTFFKRRPEDRDLTGPELRTFFKGYEIESVFADKMGWHITMGGPKEADRAYRALRNKKKLWGYPLLFDLCAAAGKVGSVQERPATTEELGSRLRKSVAPAEEESRRHEMRTRKAERVEAAMERARATEAASPAPVAPAVNELTGKSLTQEAVEREQMNDPTLPIPAVEYCSSDKALKEHLAKNGRPYVQIRPRSQRVVSPKDSVPKRVRYAADWIRDELEGVFANYKGWYLTMTVSDAANALAGYLGDDAEYIMKECEVVTLAPEVGTSPPAPRKGGDGVAVATTKPATQASRLEAPAAESDMDRDGTPMQISDGDTAPEVHQLSSSPPPLEPAIQPPPAKPLPRPAAPLSTASQASTAATSARALVASSSTAQRAPTAAPPPKPTPSPTPHKTPKAGKAIGPFSKLPTKAATPASAAAVMRKASATPSSVAGTPVPARPASPAKAPAQQEQVARNLASIPGLGGGGVGSRPGTPVGGKEVREAGQERAADTVDEKRVVVQAATGGLPTGPVQAHGSGGGVAAGPGAGTGAGTGSLPGTPVSVQPKAPRKSLW